MADSKISDLNANTTPASGDLIAIVDDPEGSAETQKATVETLATSDYFNVNSMARQAIINGNFDIWQRGTSASFSGSGVQAGYIADRYKYVFNYDGGTLPTVTISRQNHTAGDEDGSQFFMRVNSDGTGATIGADTNCIQYQKIENGTRKLADGKQVTVSIRAKSDVSGRKMGISLVQHYGTGGSPTTGETINGTYFELTTSWATYTHTFTTNTNSGKTFGTNNDDSLRLDIAYGWGTGLDSRYGGASTANALVVMNVDLDWVQLNAGSVALPFQPKSFEDELRACMRYFQKSFNYDTAPAQNAGSVTGESRAVSIVAGANAVRIRHPFLVPLRTNPTMTTYNPQAANAEIRDITNSVDCSGINTASCKEKWFYVNGTGNASTTANALVGIHWTAEAEL